VAALAFAVYSNSLAGDFVWDDRPLILSDYMVKSFDHLDHLFTNDFFFRDQNDLAYGYYRPVTTLTYVIDYALWAERPLGYHLTNCLLHAACALLVVLLLRRLGFADPIALVAGALFATHPIHTESVAWIAGRTDLVALALTAIAWLLHLAAQDDRRNRTRRIALGGAAALVFALALLAKEMAIVLVAWIALYHLVLNRHGLARAARSLAPMIAVVAGYGIWRFSVLGVSAPGQSDSAGPLEALLTVAPTVMRYLGWMIAPIGQSAYIQNPYVETVFDPRFLASAALLLIGGAVIWRFARSSPRLLFVVAAAAVSFFPVINLVRVAAPADMGAVMAERFAYFPSVFLLVLPSMGAVALWRRAADRRSLRAAVAVAVLAVLVLCAAATVLRNRVWRDEPTLFEDALLTAPDAELIWGNLANHHLRSGDLPAAERALDKLATLNADSYFALSSRALWNVMRGREDRAVALQEQIVSSSRTRNAVAVNNLAYLYRATGRTAEARELLEGLIAADRGYSDVRYNMAEILRGDGDFDGARDEYRLALAEQPDNRRIGTALAGMEIRLGRLAAAEEVFADLLRYHPRNAGLLNNLAVVYRKQERPRKAIETLKRALEIDPGYSRARSNLDELLAETSQPGAGER
jgi:tetratricopeptide (TPR) repeat protein